MNIEFDEVSGDSIDRLVELQRVRALIDSIEAELLVETASTAPVVAEFVLPGESEEERTIRIEDTVREEVACALRWTAASTQDRIDVARWLCGPLTETMKALRAGEISLAHARVIVEAAERIPEDTLAEFERRVLGTALRANVSMTRRAANRVTRALDPEGCARRRRAAKCTRDVWTFDDADGLAILMARMTREQATIAMTTIDAAARAAKRDSIDSGLTIGEHRAEALFRLVTGAQGAPALTVGVDLVVDPVTLMDFQGVTGVTMDVLAELCGIPELAITIRRLIKDPTTGHLLDYGRKTYEIPKRLRDYIAARDQICRFPGCTRRADLSQVDHAIPWDDGGETNPANLGALCTRHHQLKTFAGWDITESRDDGTCTWHSPGGRHYESDTDHDPPPEPSG